MGYCVGIAVPTSALEKQRTSTNISRWRIHFIKLISLPLMYLSYALYSIHSAHGNTLCRYTQPTTYCCSTWALWTHCSALCSWCSLLPRYFGAGPCPALSMASCSLYFTLSHCGQSVDSTATATMLSLLPFITVPSSAPERYDHVEFS